MKKLLILFLTSFIIGCLSAQKYTIISRNNPDTIKLYPNALSKAAGSALKGVVPGSPSEEVGPHNFLIKKEYKGKESLLFVEFSQNELKMLSSYETDLITPGKWETKIYTLRDIYACLKRENAIFLQGDILGIHVEMFQRPANFQDRISVDGIEFASPLKITILDEARLQAQPQSSHENNLNSSVSHSEPTANDYYIAYLMKSRKFNDTIDQKLLLELCDLKKIAEIIRDNDFIPKGWWKDYNTRLDVYAK